MDHVKVELDGAFIAARLSLSWRELHFGLVQGLITSEVCIPFAVSALGQTDAPPSRALRDLAASFGGDLDDASRVAALAAAEPDDDATLASAKWEFLVMSWYFERWYAIGDPIAVARRVSIDFNHPERLRPLLSAMPGGLLDNSSLLDRWRVYLDALERLVTR